MIRDEAYHLHALRTNGKILEGLRQLWEPKACRVNSERVIKTLNKARVGFVVIGGYGVTGYRDEPQATGDMDILVRRSHHRRAEVAIAGAFPKLAARDERLATRWEDPDSAKVVIDIWKPISPLLKKMWKYVVSIKALYQIPCLEMVLTCKLTTMLSPSRDLASRYLDAGDFMNIVEANRTDIDLDRFRELAEVAVPGRSRIYVNYLRDAVAGRTMQV